MNKVIGEVTVGQDSILHGDHHIVVSVPIADGETNIPAGCVLYQDATTGKYKALKPTDTGKTVLAVSLEEVKGTASNAVATAAVHGIVRAEKICFANGNTAAVAAVTNVLRTCGIYVAGDIDFSAE